MASEKIEPRLQAEMDRVRTTPGLTVPVVIQLGAPAEASGSGLGDLKARVHQQQAALLARLSDLGVREVEQLVLSNSIAARLTLDQIEEMATRRDTARIILNREDAVVA